MGAVGKKGGIHFAFPKLHQHIILLLLKFELPNFDLAWSIICFVNASFGREKGQISVHGILNFGDMTDRFEEGGP